MAGPFLPPKVVLDGFKERPEALAIQGLSFPLVHLYCSNGDATGDKLYIGTSTGAVQVYGLGDEQG